MVSKKKNNINNRSHEQDEEDLDDYDDEEDHYKEKRYYTFDDNDWPVLLDNSRLKYRVQNN